MTYSVIVDVVMLSYRTCVSKDCLLIIIVRVIFGVLIVLDILGLVGSGVSLYPLVPLGPGSKDPAAKGPWVPGAQEPLAPMLTLRRHLYTFVFQSLPFHSKFFVSPSC
jgi:hypothetical protein